MAEILHQLRLVVYPIIYRALYIPGGWEWEILKHQQDGQASPEPSAFPAEKPAKQKIKRLVETMVTPKMVVIDVIVEDHVPRWSICDNIVGIFMESSW